MPTPAECIDRGLMPQVDEVMYPALLEWLRGERVSHQWANLATDALTGRQKISAHKAINLPLSLLTKPILVSEECWVIDGNHRWVAAHYHKITPMRCLMIFLPFQVAIRKLVGFAPAYRFADGPQPERN